MLQGLYDRDYLVRTAAVRWLAERRLMPDMVVPVLVKGLLDDQMRSEYAEGLRNYGSSAKSAIQPLLALTQTNNPGVAGLAAWVLAEIDPTGAGKSFREQGIR